MVTLVGRKMLGNSRVGDIIKTFFPIRLFIPYMIAFVISSFEMEFLIPVPVLLYISLNWRDLVSIKQMGMKLVHNPNIADI